MKSKATQLHSATMDTSFNLTLFPGSIKAAMKETDSPSRDLWQVLIDEISPAPNLNVRTHGDAYDEHIAQIATSIFNEGFYQHKPLAGYVAKVDGKNVIYITEGESRWRAAKRAVEMGAELERLPVVVSQTGVSTEDLLVSLVRSNDGRPFSPYEIGVVCKRLVAYGWDEKKIAGRLGISDQYVRNLLSLMSAPAAIRQMVQEDKVSATTAISVIAKNGDKALDVLIGAVDKAIKIGKTKATNKHVERQNNFKRAVKDRAQEMYDLLLAISKEHGKLLPDQFNQVYSLVQEVEELRS